MLSSDISQVEKQKSNQTLFFDFKTTLQNEDYLFERDPFHLECSQYITYLSDNLIWLRLKKPHNQIILMHDCK